MIAPTNAHTDSHGSLVRGSPDLSAHATLFLRVCAYECMRADNPAPNIKPRRAP